jgi:DNA polymerase-4
VPVIAHVDMDSFFVSVELLRRPDLRGKPVIVANGTSARSRGVVMTASYEAREFGVHSALSLAIAHRRCPQAILVPSDMQLYRRASKAVMAILEEFSDTLEVAGLDEAYLDLSGSMAPKTRAREMKFRVREQTGLTCSVGLGSNKLLAKIASDLEKPDGLSVLDESDMPDRVASLPARIIPGVGPKTEQRLVGVGVRTVGELARIDFELLAGVIGPTHARGLQERANGRDGRRLEPVRESKSESRETTFDHDVSDLEWLGARLDELAGDVCASLARGSRAGRTIVLKAKLASFQSLTRSRTLPHHTRDPDEVARLGRELLGSLDTPEPLRLIGIGLSGLRRDGEAAPPPVDDGPALRLDLDAA